MNPAQPVSTPYRDLGARIRKRRQALGWRQQELAARVGVHVNSVQKWEKGEQYPERHAGRLEDVLGITLDPADRSPPTLLDERLGNEDADLIRAALRELEPERAEDILAGIEQKFKRRRAGGR